MVNGSKLALIFLMSMYKAYFVRSTKPTLVCLEKSKQELLNFFVAHGYLKGKGTSTVTTAPLAFSKLSNGCKEKLCRVSSSHFGIDFY